MNKAHSNWSKNYCILLTGTIKPAIVYSLKRTEPADRENDYYHAITRWMKFNIPIVFCENSNYQSAKIKDLTSSAFEFIQFNETEDLALKGKGYGEARIMEYAFRNSQLLQQHDYIIKVTGRLFISNFGTILKIADSLDFDIMSPLENNLKWSDSRLFILKRDFFARYFIKYAEKIDDSNGFCFERALACSIHELLADNKKWEMLPRFPKFVGYSGTYNKRYSIFRNNAMMKAIRFRLFKYICKP
jgi:hypothetical protein